MKKIISQDFKEVYNNLFRKAWYNLGFKTMIIKIYDSITAGFYELVVTPNSLSRCMSELRRLRNETTTVDHLMVEMWR